MQLDYEAKTGTFVLRVPRSTPNCAELVQALMKEYGLNFFIGSPPDTAMMVTKEPYAAATFADHATDRAKGQLGAILPEITASWRLTSDAHIACPEDRELWGVQKAGIEYAMRRKHTLIGDEPGVGKTPTAICYANEIRAEHVGVIVPANIRMQWAKKISEWSTMRWPYYTNIIMNGKKGVHPTNIGKPGWNIVSYDLARSPAIWSALAKEKYDLLILDECHYLKTVDSLRTQTIFGGGDNPIAPAIASRAEHILGLTGTPLPNRPREAYTIARALNFDSIDWMSEDHFKERFNPSMRDVRMVNGKWKVYVDERNGRNAELQNRMRANFMVRRLLHDALPQLKLPVYDLVYLEKTGAVKEALQAESMLDINPDDLSGADIAILGDVSVVRRQMGVAMAPQVAEYVDMLIQGGETKIVLFAWHHEVMDILQRALGHHGLIRIDGMVSPVAKEQRKMQFINDPRCQIALGNLQSMGLGVDGLQEVSHHALIAEPSWVAGDNIQAFRRLVRGGQLNRVQGDIFVVENSFAERLLATALRKLHTTHATLDKQFSIE